MSIQDTNPVNAAYTNTRVASKQDDNILGGTQSLTHNNVESGADILDLQKTVNDLVNILAIIGQGNTGSNVGGGIEVFKEKVANDLRFRTLQGTNSVTVALNGDLIDIGHPIEFLVADPGAPVAPQLWFNYTDKVWRFWDGVVITEIGSDYVDLSTNQTAAGEKTWSNDAYFSQDIQVTGKATILGDMEVQGSLTYINTTDLEVTDANVLVNKGGSDGTAEGSGLSTERPSGNASILFDSSLDNKYKLGLDSDFREVVTIVKGTQAVLDALPTKYTSVLYFATDTTSHLTWDGSAFVPLSMPSLAKGGIITHNGAGYLALAVGADGKIIKADSSQSEGLKYEEITLEGTDAAINALPRIKGQTYWASNTDIFYYDTGVLLVEIGGSGATLTLPLTTKGDLLGHNGAAALRVGVGANGTIVKADSAQSEGIKYEEITVEGTDAAILALPRIKGQSYYSSDTDIYYYDNGVSLKQVGGTGVPSSSPLTTKGDLLTNNGATDLRLGVGNNGERLTADSTDPNGVKWKANTQFATKATIDAATKYTGEFFYATDEAIFYIYDGAVLIPVTGSGGGMSILRPVDYMDLADYLGYITPTTIISGIAGTQIVSSTAAVIKRVEVHFKPNEGTSAPTDVNLRFNLWHTSASDPGLASPNHICSFGYYRNIDAGASSESNNYFSIEVKEIPVSSTIKMRMSLSPVGQANTDLMVRFMGDQ